MAVPTLVQMLASTTGLFGGYGLMGTGPYKYTLPNVTKTGNALLVACSYDNGVTGLSFSDNINGAWPAAIFKLTNTNGNSVNSAFYLFTGIANPSGVPTTVTATFTGGPPAAFQWNIFEFANVTGHNGTHGTAAVAGASLATGSFTPGNNNANGGNLVLSYFATATLLSSTTGPNPWVADSGHTLLEADMTGFYQGATGGYCHATQSFQQNTSAAINPTMVATGDTTNAYNCLAIALTAGSAGTGPPSSGIYVAKVFHQSVTVAAASTTLKLQIPWTGNLRFVGAYTGQSQVFTSLTDSDSYSWTNEAAAVDDLWAYATNTAPDTNATLSIAFGTQSGGSNFTFRCYDIWNAAASPYDNYVAGTASVTGTTTITSKPSITPVANASGLTIAGGGLVTGPGLTITAPSGAIDDVTHYGGEVDNDNYDNADLHGHYYFPNNTIQNWSWTITSESPNTFYYYAITFLSSQGIPIWLVVG